MEGLNCLLFGILELFGAILLRKILQYMFTYYPFIFSINELIITIQTIIVYLQIRALLNGVLVGVTRILYGNEIIIEETWKNLAKAQSLRQVSDSILYLSELKCTRYGKGGIQAFRILLKNVFLFRF